MPYRKSRARREFDLASSANIKVMDRCLTKKKEAKQTREYVLSCGVILTMAHIQQYLEDVVGDWILRLHQCGTRNKNLPLRVRAFYLNSDSIMSAHRNYISDGDEATFLDKIEKQSFSHLLSLVDDHSAVPALRPSIILREKTYPSPKNIEALFSRLGAQKVFNEVNRISRKDMRSVLVSFNDVRTVIAHEGAIPVGTTLADLLVQTVKVADLVAYIDRAFFDHVIKHSGYSTWPK